MKLSQRSIDALKISGIPSYMHESIMGYYEEGWTPGGFLSAIINNDLKEAIIRSDDNNIDRFKQYMMWFYNYAPAGTWGYKGAVKDYLNSLAKRRLEDA